MTDCRVVDLTEERVQFDTASSDDDDLFMKVVKARAKEQGYVTVWELLMIKEAVASVGLEHD